MVEPSSGVLCATFVAGRVTPAVLIFVVEKVMGQEQYPHYKWPLLIIRALQGTRPLGPIGLKTSRPCLTVLILLLYSCPNVYWCTNIFDQYLLFETKIGCDQSIVLVTPDSDNGRLHISTIINQFSLYWLLVRRSEGRRIVSSNH